LSLHENGETVDPEFNESLIMTTDPYVPATMRNQPSTKKMAEKIIVVHQNLVLAARQLSHIHMYVSV
jgi:hypothetical protein